MIKKKGRQTSRMSVLPPRKVGQTFLSDEAEITEGYETDGSNHKKAQNNAFTMINIMRI